LPQDGNEPDDPFPEPMDLGNSASLPPASMVALPQPAIIPPPPMPARISPDNNLAPHFNRTLAPDDPSFRSIYDESAQQHTFVANTINPYYLTERFGKNAIHGFNFRPKSKLSNHHILRINHPRTAAYFDNLVRSGVLIPSAHPKHLIPHYFIEEQHGTATKSKLRLIANCRELNASLPEPPSFRMFGHPAHIQQARKYNYVSGIDLKSAFFHIPIHRKSQSYFGVAVSVYNQPPKFYTYTRIPFGLSWSPYLLHACLDPLIVQLRKQKIAVSHYADDINIFSDSLEQAEHDLQIVSTALNQANWMFNPQKILKPTTIAPILGFYYNLNDKTMYPIKDFLWLASTYSRHCPPTKKSIQRILGHLVFICTPARQLLSYLDPLFHYLHKSKFHFNRKLLIALTHKIIKQLNSHFPLSMSKPLNIQIVCADATPTQIAAINYATKQVYIKQTPQTKIFENEAKALFSLLPKRNDNYTYILLTDNQALAHAIIKGRSHNHTVNKILNKYVHLSLFPIFIPTHTNEADHLSRIPLKRKKYSFNYKSIHDVLKFGENLRHQMGLTV
jgi:hypothetical protein